MFPKIEHIDDIWPYIKDTEGQPFSLRKKLVDDYEFQVITYDVINSLSQFESSLAREARGIKFDINGKIISRPLHKFFNLNEFKELEPEDVCNPEFIYEKLDGSMIHPILLPNGNIRFCTKSGISDVSLQFEEENLFNETQLKAIKELCIQNITPIFEYTSPKNRIVVSYDKSEVTLLAARENKHGIYLDLKTVANFVMVKTPPTYDSYELVHNWKRKEGVVLVYKSGVRLKVKAADYVLKHKTKEVYSNKKNLVLLIINNELDDLANLIDVTDFRQLQLYSEKVFNEINDYVKNSLNLLNTEFKNMTKKEIALKIYAPTCTLTSLEKTIFWFAYNQSDPNLLRLKIIDFIREKIHKVDSIIKANLYD